MARFSLILSIRSGGLTFGKSSLLRGVAKRDIEEGEWQMCLEAYFMRVFLSVSFLLNLCQDMLSVEQNGSSRILIDGRSSTSF